jgi:hypothetical protein
MKPEDATTWRAVSHHADLDRAERQLRHVYSGPHFYDADGRLIQAWATAKPRWALPPKE